MSAKTENNKRLFTTSYKTNFDKKEENQEPFQQSPVTEMHALDIEVQRLAY